MVCAERHARLEPLLQAIYDFLDKQPALVERVRRDLVRGLKQPWQIPQSRHREEIQQARGHLW